LKLSKRKSMIYTNQSVVVFQIRTRVDDDFK
jgi:hypothetical protein